MSDKAEFKVVVESPFGKQPLEQFGHFISKVADEAAERWNITINVERVDQ